MTTLMEIVCTESKMMGLRGTSVVGFLVHPTVPVPVPGPLLSGLLVVTGDKLVPVASCRHPPFAAGMGRVMALLSSTTSHVSKPVCHSCPLIRSLLQFGADSTFAHQGYGARRVRASTLPFVHRR